MNFSNVTSDLKPTGKTGSAMLLYAAGIATLVLPLLYPIVINYLMAPYDAAVVKTLFFDTFRTAMPILLGGGGLGVVAASALKTGGKVVRQLAPGMATDATPHGEGIGAPESDKNALKNAAIGLATDQLQHASGVDLSGALNYVDVTPPGVPMESE